MKNNFYTDFEEARSVLEQFLADENNFKLMEKAGDAIINAFSDGKKVLSCGNGGSMSDAMHFAEELTGRFRDERPSLPAISISDPTHISCVANDYGFDYVFSRYVESVGNEGDVLLAISTSGNSANIINAVEAALKKGMIVIGLTGKTGGEMARLCTYEIRVSHNGYSDRIQEIHIKIIHSLINYIEQKLNGK